MVLLKARPVSVLVAGVLIAGAVGLAAAPAQAGTQTCTNIPGTTPGTTLTVGGQTVRVPSISNIQICISSADAGLISLSTTGGSGCTLGCLTLSLLGAVDAGAVSVSYTEDGSPKTHQVDPPGVGDPNQSTCLVSVGSPVAPVPTCTIALGVDNVQQLQDLVDDVVAAVLDLVGGLDDTACAAIPNSPSDPWGGGGTSFCVNPVQWTQEMAAWTLYTVCGDCDVQAIVVAAVQLVADVIRDIPCPAEDCSFIITKLIADTICDLAGCE